MTPALIAALRQCVADHGWPAVRRQLAARRLGLPAPPEELESISWEDLAERLDGAPQEHLGATIALIPRPLIEAEQERHGIPEPLWRLLIEERDRQVRAAVRRLPLLEKRVIRLHYWEDVPLTRMTEAVGSTTVSSVSRIHRRALGQLRRLLTTREAHA